jgi:hypothetical protein
MTKERKLNGEAKPIGMTAPSKHEFQICPRECVEPDQFVAIRRHAEQLPSFIIVQQPRRAMPLLRVRPEKGISNDGLRLVKGHKLCTDVETIGGGPRQCPQIVQLGDAAWATCRDTRGCRPAIRTPPGSGFGASLPARSACSRTCARTSMDRPGLAESLAYARKSDALAVTRLDRLGRSLAMFLSTVAMLKERGIDFVSLEEKIDTSSAAGELVFHVFGAIATSSVG